MKTNRMSAGIVSIGLFLLAGGGYGADKSAPYYVLSSRQKSILTDCSGAAYRPESNTYFVIENRMGNVFEVNAAKRILNMYPTRLARDTEGITYAGNNIFYVCGEAETGIYEVELKDGKFVLKRSARLTELGKPNNDGLEGIAYCRPRNSLFCVKERRPAVLLELDLAEGRFGKIKRQMEFKSVRDLAGAAYDESSGYLLVLSQMDRVVLVLDPETWKEAGRFPAGGRQPEGICMGPPGTLCIVSEPTYIMFYKLGKPGEPAAAAKGKKSSARPSRRTTPAQKPLKIKAPLLVMSFDSSLHAEVGPKPTKGSYPLVPGKKGKAVDLTGKRTSLWVQADGALDGNELIVDFWFKPTWSTPAKRTYELFRMHGADSSFVIMEYNKNSGVLQVEMIAKPKGRLAIGGAANGLIKAGQWHHVVAGWRIEGPKKAAASLALDGVVLSDRVHVRGMPAKGLDLTKCRVYVGSCRGRSIHAAVDEFRIGK